VSLKSDGDEGRKYALNCQDNLEAFISNFFKNNWKEGEEPWEKKLERYMEKVDLKNLFPYEISNDISYVNAIYNFLNNVLGLHGLTITEPEKHSSYW
jgi:hypothetical protein